jgi:hypothetical protein
MHQMHPFGPCPTMPHCWPRWICLATRHPARLFSNGLELDVSSLERHTTVKIATIDIADLCPTSVSEWRCDIASSDNNNNNNNNDIVINSVMIMGQATPASNHDNFFDPLRDFIQDDVKNTFPFLYLNGDVHAWK